MICIETIKKYCCEDISEALKGKPRSEEVKRKISEAKIGHIVSEEARRKISEANKGRRWFNNGEISVLRIKCPEGFVPGRLNYNRGGNK